MEVETPPAPIRPKPSASYLERAQVLSGGKCEPCQQSTVASPSVITSSTPVSSAQKHSSNVKLVRAYTVWPTHNTFCCFGHLMTGPAEDIGPNFFAWLLVVAPMMLFFWGSGHVFLHTSLWWQALVITSFASTIFWLLATSFTDPGIIQVFW